MAIITLQNISIRYGHTEAVQNVSLSIESGDYLLIRGSNGSGKSTLVKGLLGLQPVDGKIIFGEGMTRRDIGYLPQQCAAVSGFPATALEIVLSGFAGGGLRFTAARQKDLARFTLKRVGIDDVRAAYSQLSGGQQQRVMLARAIVSARRLLVLDEPAASLDAEFTDKLYEIAGSLNSEGCAILMISHDEGAVKYANKILELDHSIRYYGGAANYEHKSESQCLGVKADA